jgi:hypothetical protein
MGEDRTVLQEGIDRLVGDWQPQEIRDLGNALLRLADGLDARGDNPLRPVFAWPATMTWIERNASNLAAKAQVFWEQRDRRRQFIDNDLLGEPAWDMLLDLFVQFAKGAKVPTTSLCIASRVPMSTALRYVNLLEEAGYAVRSQSDYDGRVSLVSLTDAGALALGQYLERYC